MLERYLGIPYREGGRGWDGCDCWGLVRLILLEERGIALPLFSDVRSTEDFVRMRGMFRRIDRPCDWCMVDMRSRGRFPAHVGLYLDGSVIQAYETGVAVQPLGRVMPMVRGFYRPEIPS